jgi:hypothetical protein
MFEGQKMTLFCYLMLIALGLALLFLLAQNFKGFSHSSIFIGASPWRHYYIYSYMCVVATLCWFCDIQNLCREPNTHICRNDIICILYTSHLTSSFNHNLISDSYSLKICFFLSFIFFLLLYFRFFIFLFSDFLFGGESMELRFGLASLWWC